LGIASPEDLIILPRGIDDAGNVRVRDHRRRRVVVVDATDELATLLENGGGDQFAKKAVVMSECLRTSALKVLFSFAN
jgi:hypothetical protein